MPEIPTAERCEIDGEALTIEHVTLHLAESLRTGDDGDDSAELRAHLQWFLSILKAREAAHVQAITALQQKLDCVYRDIDRSGTDGLIMAVELREAKNQLAAQDAQIAALQADLRVCCECRFTDMSAEVQPPTECAFHAAVRGNAESQLRTVGQALRELPRYVDGTIPINDGLKRNLPECDVCTVVRAEDLDAILVTIEGQGQ